MESHWVIVLAKARSGWVLERSQGAGWIGGGDQRQGEESGDNEVLTMAWRRSVVAFKSKPKDQVCNRS